MRLILSSVAASKRLTGRLCHNTMQRGKSYGKNCEYNARKNSEWNYILTDLLIPLRKSVPRESVLTLATATSIAQNLNSVACPVLTFHIFGQAFNLFWQFLDQELISYRYSSCRCCYCSSSSCSFLGRPPQKIGSGWNLAVLFFK